MKKKTLLETRESRAGMQLPASAPRLKAVRHAAAAARPPGANSHNQKGKKKRQMDKASSYCKRFSNTSRGYCARGLGEERGRNRL